MQYQGQRQAKRVLTLKNSASERKPRSSAQKRLDRICKRHGQMILRTKTFGSPKEICVLRHERCVHRHERCVHRHESCVLRHEGCVLRHQSCSYDTRAVSSDTRAVSSDTRDVKDNTTHSRKGALTTARPLLVNARLTGETCAKNFADTCYTASGSRAGFHI